MMGQDLHFSLVLTMHLVKELQIKMSSLLNRIYIGGYIFKSTLYWEGEKELRFFPENISQR